MTIPEIKYKLFKAIDKIEDDKLLTELLHILQNEQEYDADFWGLLTEEQKAEINTAIKENAEPEKLISNEKLQARILKSTIKK